MTLSSLDAIRRVASLGGIFLLTCTTQTGRTDQMFVAASRVYMGEFRQHWRDYATFDVRLPASLKNVTYKIKTGLPASADGGWGDVRNWPVARVSPNTVKLTIPTSFAVKVRNIGGSAAVVYNNPMTWVLEIDYAGNQGRPQPSGGWFTTLKSWLNYANYAVNLFDILQGYGNMILGDLGDWAQDIGDAAFDIVGDIWDWLGGFFGF